MDHIDKLHTDYPFYGSRQLTAHLNRLGWCVNRKRIQRLMRLMHIRGLAPGADTSKPHPGHRVYPYLLRGLPIVKPGRVWATDITYIPLNTGFMYLCAIIDWYSRYVIDFELSNTLAVQLPITVLTHALQTSRKPEIFNTDQGSQFTSTQFTQILLHHDIQISMDGKGRAVDNVIIECLWRSMKYENIYLKDYTSPPECRRGLKLYVRFYNFERPHSSLGGAVPAQMCN